MLPTMLEQDRKRAGWSVKQAAWRLGVSISEYRELEAGYRSPSFETWDRVLQAPRLASDICLLHNTLSDPEPQGTPSAGEWPFFPDFGVQSPGSLRPRAFEVNDRTLLPNRFARSGLWESISSESAAGVTGDLLS